ncbi:general secretion pathway protein GspD [Leptobacterium flavescens]|uniref:General secretion pathway protein GspD n=1 Tax=Leptobacterium flavescens TaxID=472055 RepID=A0A6P0UKB6_9FLAO|nr:type II and III secretion system protein [Leptobacterium flavescens]NER12992.1 general secretion pathway protein GspD [Leptobacterium flavescens]
MIRKWSILCLLFLCFWVSAQDNRIENIKNRLEVLSVENKGLTEELKLNINVTDITLPNFLTAVSKVHQLNINISSELNSITLVNNFPDVNVADLLVFLCKEYDLDIDFTGNILSVKKYSAPPLEVEERIIPVKYNAVQDIISLDLKNDKLYDAFIAIMNESGKKLSWSPDIADKPITSFINGASFHSAMSNLAFANDLLVTKNKDGFYLFEDNSLVQGTTASNTTNTTRPRPRRNKSSSFYYKVLDTLNQVIEVDFENIPIKDVISDIGNDLKVNIFTAKPLDEAGTATFKTKYIAFDDLLDKLFEAQQSVSVSTSNNVQTSSSTSRQQSGLSGSSGLFTYKKEGNTYFFGTSDQLSVRKIEVIQLQHRSVELLGDPSGSFGSQRSAGRTQGGNLNFIGGSANGFQNNNNFGNNNNFNNRNNNNNRVNRNQQGFNSGDSKAETLISILPEDVKMGLDITMDVELNSFMVSGPAPNVNRFKAFLNQIDKPVPFILIEVILLEINKSATIESGISWGIGDEPVNTRGGLFPNTDITLGAKTVNRIIGGFDGFTNIGKVVPNFFANIKAMEANGLVKIRSTPKLSTLNGHRASLSIGETTYYVVTSQNFFGSQIPQSTEIRNFVPIDAELAINVKPSVSGDGQITLDVNVVQSDFNGARIDEDAPPGLNSREFSSIIRVRDQDIAVLGGLEEKIKNDSGNGVPFLARVPVIKWFFSQRRREDTKRKLTVLIKPTIIY